MPTTECNKHTSDLAELLEGRLLLELERYEEEQAYLAALPRRQRLFDPAHGPFIRRDIFGYYQTGA